MSTLQKIREVRNRKPQGSALLVALLVMGLLLTLTLGISYLVVREIRQTGDIVLAGKAYFAAEAGVEQALYGLSQNLPGYETMTEAEDGWVVYEDDDFSYRYRIDNKGDTIPYFEDDQPIFLTPENAVTKSALYELLPGKTYNVLPLNQTVTIPLFTDNGNGTYSDVENFLIQYYVDFDLDENADVFGGRRVVLENFDILRWKLFGNPECPGGADRCQESARTDAISDFYPAFSSDAANNPVCIGSDQTLLDGEVAGSEYTCNPPVARDIQEGAVGGQGVLEDILDASWSFARECYQRDAGLAVAAVDIQRGCSIKTFVQNHTRNYITLTNMVNPDIVGISNPQLRNARANIYYRIIAKPGPDEPKLVREAAHIRSDGFAGGGKVRQSIDTNIRMSSFLPVFNFSLYRTDTSLDKGNVDSPRGGAVSEEVGGGGLGGLGI